MVPHYEISKCPEHEVKSKIGSIFINEKIFEEKSVNIYEIDPYFYEHYKEKIQVDNNDWEYILFRINVYFTEYFLAVEIDEKGHTDRDLIFEEKRQKALEKKLNCEFIRINTSRENYDADYEASRIQTFINKFKNKEKENEIKKLEDEIKKLKLQLTNQSTQNNNDDNNKKKRIIIMIIKVIIVIIIIIIINIKLRKRPEATYCVGCKTFTHNFRP